MNDYRVGDLVHIPQSVVMLDCQYTEDSQLTIPVRVHETDAPTLGVVTSISNTGYVEVYCDGLRWSVKNSNIYSLQEPE